MRARLGQDAAELRDEQVAREAPLVLFLCAGIIVVFDLVLVALGPIPPLPYFLSDGLQLLYIVVVGTLLARRLVPLRWAPALFATAVVVNNAVLLFQWQYLGWTAIGVSLLLIAAYGAVVCSWRPFLVSGAIILTVSTVVLVLGDSANGPGWALNVLTGLMLSAAIMYGRLVTVDKLAAAQAEVRELAIRDSLTGLLNRRGLEMSSEVLVGLARRERLPLFAVFTDVAGLKTVNDTFGHDAGDRVIVETSRALREQCRASDLVCRWGGDEIVIVGVGRPPDAAELAERVHTVLDTPLLREVWEPKVWFGSAQSLGLELDTLITKADEDMYRHRAGRED